MKNFQYKHYALVLLTVVSVFNYLDRGVLALAMEAIKAEFDLKDSQLGLMSGFAFALFYAVVGLPIARWADCGNRNHVVTLTTALWSAMLVMCGLAGSFTQLLLARVGVAVGESGCVPAGQSLISDYFNRAERPRALAIYLLGGFIASAVSYAGGGWLLDQYGWRITFMLIGLPGVVLAILVKLTLREPRLTFKSRTSDDAPPLKHVLRVLWSGRAFRHLLLSFCISTFFSFGIITWFPAFFMRSYGMEAASIGIWLGGGIGVLGLLSTYLGGYLAARYAPNKEALQLKSMGFLIGVGALLLCLCFLSSDRLTSLLLMSASLGVILPLVSAPTFAAIQSLVDKRMRAMALAIIYMLSNLIGMGLGPLAVGFASDQLAAGFGQESLRYAMLLFAPGLFWCVFHQWKAAATIEEEILTAEASTESGPVQDAAEQARNKSTASNKLSPAS